MKENSDFLQLRFYEIFLQFFLNSYHAIFMNILWSSWKMHMRQSEVELYRLVQWARAQTIEMFSFYSRLLATSYLNMAVLKQAPQKQADLWSIPILNKRVVLWTWSESPSYGLLFTMRKNLPKTLDQLIFCKYTLVFSKCSQIY